MSRTYPVGASWQLVLHDLGVDPADLLPRVGLPPDLLTQDRPRLDAASWLGLWEALQDALGGDDLALRLGQGVPVEAYDPSLLAALCSQDLVGAVERLSTYKQLTCPFALGLDEGAARTTVEVRGADGLTLPRTLARMELVFLVHFARRATRAEIRPLEVQVPAGELPGPAYAAWFGAPVREGGGWCLVFRTEDARRPFLTANAALQQVYEPELQRRLAQARTEAPTAERLRGRLLELLPSGRTTIEAAARALGLSVRSLQRRLREEGTSFQAELATARERLATHYLRTSSLPPAEISFLLGYDDPNSFFRAFHAWTGRTPEGVRGEA
ncbi:MAG: AraC family transcriptional regulator ligand-binding domain-containing protein [Alphaproteobacteria bacterium]|nr:AraC family transcriptional regulator ligand-binding domain-containing protein [Alphaproteobacteria bacterium]